ncbi:hypothetical protein SELMODRAFT_96403 [Selaginella moellendorffii]|uniref:Pyruvate dehydrogenase E1 component subunit alpha n=1 Tax=Selaginella moellendorffii TaxID=88036 RepID=D8RLY8_SELML|nr:hypothetical protein SELMODRAFT_97821 [Selaginella moellendorffii]EFJ27009.1 hypothetical protein SELMODRAFT_96403 [Selaginella moellendorffii]
MTRSTVGSLARRLFASQPRQAAAAQAPDAINVEIPVPFQLHLLQEGPARESVTSREELVKMYRDMFRIRRMEITADKLFKSQLVRGFCHLYDGQEAVTIGMEAALTYEDTVITAYRDHATFLGRGGTVHECFAELMGRSTGCARGKGGSMHLYKPSNNFYGGWGIVGTTGPLGAGLAFANKYEKKNNVAMAIYGDGAGNQGQLFEAKNMAGLWDLPLIFLVENNHYGMGTAEWRASKKTTFYDRVSYIPGIKVDGMDAFAVKEATRFAKEHCLSGKGPIVLEADTYRYHGHSMSDPGSTYRTRNEIQGVRQERDPIERIKKLMIKENVMREEEFKAVDKEIKQEVDDAAAKAKDDPNPGEEELFMNIYKNDSGLKTYGCDRNMVRVQLP